MADLLFREKRELERLLQMGDGHLLHFSHTTLKEFVSDSVRRNIQDPRYGENNSGSKANLMRAFWKLEGNALVATLLADLVEEAGSLPEADVALVKTCQAVVARLKAEAPTADLDAFDIASGDFEQLFTQIRQAVAGDEPEAALDRLHTLMMRFGRQLCESVGVSTDKKMPLNAVFGAYFRRLHERGHIQTKMTQSILKATTGVLEAFNDVRNNHTLAHDNPTLNRDESLLIVNHIASTVRFLRALDERLASEAKKAPAPMDSFDDDDIPF